MMTLPATDPCQTFFYIKHYLSFSSMYFDEDGDLAHEFYEEVMPKKGKGRRKMKKINCKFLTPQGDVPYQTPRIHVDFPVILHQG